MKKKIIFATRNAGKVQEFRQLLADEDVEVLSLLDFHEMVDIEETGATFEENARLKAVAVSLMYGGCVVADDSGLEVVALNGAPGVYSARYQKAHDDQANMDRVLKELEKAPGESRAARFVCVLVMIDECGKETVVEGVCEGLIHHEKRGSNGFGYDPIFYISELGKTMAELTNAKKNELSHRGKAFEKLKKIIGDVK